MPVPNLRFPRRAVLVSTAGLLAAAATRPPVMLRGFNFIQTAACPLDGAAAARSLRALAATAANCVALIPFLWQAGPTSARVDIGSDMALPALAAGIAEARRLGLAVMMKPHIWVPGGWAGQIAPPGEEAWRSWFADYGRHIAALAEVAERAGARHFAIGTELQKTVDRPEWLGVIEAVRRRFSGRIVYVAQGAEGGARVPFTGALDAIGVTLYPALGGDRDEAAWRRVMRREVAALVALRRRTGKPVWIAEIGARSAVGTAARPWESAEERAAPPDPAVQARILSAWLDELTPLGLEGILIWRWLSDPAGGGPADTDFTVQGKAAETMLRRRWSAS